MNPLRMSRMTVQQKIQTLNKPEEKDKTELNDYRKPKQSCM